MGNLRGRGELATCGFIGDAKEESIDMLLKAIALKQQGKVGRVFAMGCLSERYRGELAEEMPELDGLYGKFDWSGIADVLAAGETPARPSECTKACLSKS